jgi:hypothetical protein
MDGIKNDISRFRGNHSPSQDIPRLLLQGHQRVLLWGSPCNNQFCQFGRSSAEVPTENRSTVHSLLLPRQPNVCKIENTSRHNIAPSSTLTIGSEWAPQHVPVTIARRMLIYGIKPSAKCSQHYRYMSGTLNRSSPSNFRMLRDKLTIN